MAKLKLTKTLAEAARPETVPYELRDTIIPGFLLKVTPAGRKIFMVAYVANDGQRRKPAIGRFGEVTVEQARGIAQDWLADVRKGRIHIFIGATARSCRPERGAALRCHEHVFRGRSARCESKL
jgi:Arm DNA-binding domain